MKHAFLILEPKRNDASKMVRHVLCSPSDQDRDEWITCLLYYVAMEPEPSQPSIGAAPTSRGKRLLKRQNSDTSTQSEIMPIVAQPTVPEGPSNLDTIGIRYDQMSQGKRPNLGTTDSTPKSSFSVEDAPRRSPEQLRVNPPNVPSRSPYRTPISGPINGAPIADEVVWTSVQPEEERRKEEKRAKKRSVWNFLSKGTTSFKPTNVR
jgi:RalA-binding protein 1